MQRRRRSKAVPRDIFGNPTTPSNTPKPTGKQLTPPTGKPSVKPPAKPPAKPPEISKPIEDSEPETAQVSEEPDSEEDLDSEVVNEQILRSPRKSIGLRPNSETVDEEPVETVSNRAKEIIDESKERAKTEPVVRAKTVLKPAPEVKPPPKPKPRRRRSSSFQPANRAKRLDRSRHMEYKYEMRGLLQELNIPEEHRSNLLGTIWARGERLTIADAKQFISEKSEQGVLTEEQESTLRSVVDRYTVRR